jgi:hypothetical protein
VEKKKNFLVFGGKGKGFGGKELIFAKKNLI